MAASGSTKRAGQQLTSMAAFVCDIWHAYRKLPLWVQVWVVPLTFVVSVAPFLVIPDPLGWLGLANIGCILLGNLPMLLHYRGFVKAMGASDCLRGDRARRRRALCALVAVHVCLSVEPPQLEQVPLGVRPNGVASRVA